MRIQRSWHKHKVQKEFRRQVNAGETQRQTVYTLLLTFVPFATIVAALSVISNAEVVEALSRHVRQVDSALTEIRHAAGVDGKTDVGTLVRQAVWAFHKKAEFEIRYVKDANDPAKRDLLFGYTTPDGEVIKFGEEAAHLEMLACLRREERLQALTQNVEDYVVREVDHKSVEDLSEQARSESKAISEHNLRDREAVLYEMFLRQALTQKKLNQGDIKLLVANVSSLKEIESAKQIEVSASGDDKINSWLSERRSQFCDPPERGKGVETDVAQSYRAEQLLALWQELPGLRNKVDAITVPGPNEPNDFLERNLPTVIARLSNQIKGLALDPEERGPLTQLAVSDRAKAIIEVSKADMRKQLMTAIPDDIDVRTADLVKRELRPNPDRAQRLLDQYLLARCQEASLPDKSTVLRKADLQAFPEVVNRIEGVNSRLYNNLVAQVTREIQARIKQIDEDQNQLDPLLAQVPAGVLPQVANLEVRKKYLVPDMFPKLGLEGFANEVRKMVGGPEEYPLNEKEDDRLTGILATHIRSNATKAQRAAILEVKGITEVTLLSKERDLRKYRKGSEALEALTNRVSESLLTPDARQFEAVRHAAINHAGSLVEAQREMLLGYLAAHMKRVLDKRLQETESAPIGKTERAQFAKELLAKAFPVQTPDVVAELQDLNGSLADTLLEGVVLGLDGLAVRRAIEAVKLDDDYNPFQENAEALLKKQMVAYISKETGASLNEADAAAAQDRAAQLHAAARNHQLSDQLQAIQALTDGDLPETIIDVRDEQKAFDALETLVLNRVSHKQLGDPSIQALTSKVKTFVARREEYTANIQVEKIDTFRVADLPEEAVRWITKGDKAQAGVVATKVLTQVICSETKTMKLVDAANTKLQTTIGLLVKEKYLSIVDVQMQIVKGLTVLDLPDSTTELIGEAQNEGPKALVAIQNEMDALVRKRSNTTVASSVLAEVRTVLHTKCAELVEEKYQSIIAVQVEEIKTLAVSDLPDSAVCWILKGNKTKAGEEAARVLSRSVCSQTKTPQLVGTAGSKLQGRIRHLVEEKYESIVAIQLEAVRGLSEADIPETVIRQIVADDGDESRAVELSMKACDALVRNKTNTTEGETVLNDVRAELSRICSRLVKTKRAAELNSQCDLVKENIDNYVIRPKGGQSFDELLDLCTDSICALAGIDKQQQLPGTRAFLKKEIRDRARKEYDRLEAATLRVEELLKSIKGDVDGVVITPPESNGSDVTKETGVTQRNNNQTKRTGRLILEGATIEELQQIEQSLVPIVRKEEVMREAQTIIKKEVEWKVEWFASYYSSPTSSPPYDLRQRINKHIVETLKTRNFDSAAQYEKDITAELEKEWREIYKWCDGKAKDLLASDQCKRLMDDELKPYVQREKDIYEWYGRPDDIIPDSKKIEAEAVKLAHKLVNNNQ